MKNLSGTILIFSILSLTSGKSISQQLTPVVTSTGGGFYQNASGMLSFTIGEMSVIETFTTSSYTLTQGFQQVWDIETSIASPSNIPFSVRIYPNPTSETLTIDQLEVGGNLTITDLSGRVLHSSNIVNSRVEVNVAKYSSGVYFVKYISNGQVSMKKICVN